MLGDEAFERRLRLLHLRADECGRCGDGAGFVLVLGEPADEVQDQFGVRRRGESDRRFHDGRRTPYTERIAPNSSACPSSFSPIRIATRIEAALSG